MPRKSEWERISDFYKSARKRDHEGMLREVVPPDVYAGYRAGIYGSGTSQPKPVAQDPEAELRERLSHADIEGALLLLERSFSYGRHRRPLPAGLPPSTLRYHEETWNDLDARKTDLVRGILENDRFDARVKIDLSIFFGGIQPQSRTDLATLNNLLSNPGWSDFPLRLELGWLRDSISAYLR